MTIVIAVHTIPYENSKWEGIGKKLDRKGRMVIMYDMSVNWP